MQGKSGCGAIEVVYGDITKEHVDAIVNAANPELAGGGGVDGAIHKAAGPQLLEECKRLGGCLTGDAKTTGAYNLPCSWVIHAVGPVWRGGLANEDELLACAYRRALEEACRIGAESVAFPAISTGAYGFPAERAARIAVSTIRLFLEGRPEMRVRLVAFSKTSAHVLKQALEERQAEEGSWK